MKLNKSKDRFTNDKFVLDKINEFVNIIHPIFVRNNFLWGNTHIPSKNELSNETLKQINELNENPLCEYILCGRIRVARSKSKWILGLQGPECLIQDLEVLNFDVNEVVEQITMPLVAQDWRESWYDRYDKEF